MSHVRFGEDPIDASYYLQQADYIPCHKPAYLQKFDTVGQLKKGGVYVVNIAEGTDFDEAFPAAMRKHLTELDAKVYAIDATALSVKLGIPGAST
jgi:pyruvate-ferredoxin/flavodoxin oxidoreductase